MSNGIEIHYQVNVVAPLYLNLKIGSTRENCIFINFGSRAIFRATKPTVQDLIDSGKYSQFGGPYAKSKLLLASLSYFLSKYDTQNKWLTVDPGNIKTKMTTSEALPKAYKFIAKKYFKSAEEFSAEFDQLCIDDLNSFKSGSYIERLQFKSLPQRVQGINPISFLNLFSSLETSFHLGEVAFNLIYNKYSAATFSKEVLP